MHLRNFAKPFAFVLDQIHILFQRLCFDNSLFGSCVLSHIKRVHKLFLLFFFLYEKRITF